MERRLKGTKITSEQFLDYLYRETGNISERNRGKLRRISKCPRQDGTCDILFFDYIEDETVVALGIHKDEKLGEYTFWIYTALEVQVVDGEIHINFEAGEK